VEIIPGIFRGFVTLLKLIDKVLNYRKKDNFLVYPGCTLASWAKNRPKLWTQAKFFLFHIVEKIAYLSIRTSRRMSAPVLL
jgi:hypothetical protein